MLQMAQYNWIWMGSQPSNLVEKIKEFTRFVSNVVNKQFSTYGIVQVEIN